MLFSYTEDADASRLGDKPQVIPLTSYSIYKLKLNLWLTAPKGATPVN